MRTRAATCTAHTSDYLTARHLGADAHSAGAQVHVIADGIIRMVNRNFISAVLVITGDDALSLYHCINDGTLGATVVDTVMHFTNA